MLLLLLSLPAELGGGVLFLTPSEFQFNSPGFLLLLSPHILLLLLSAELFFAATNNNMLLLITVPVQQSWCSFTTITTHTSVVTFSRIDFSCNINNNVIINNNASLAVQMFIN